MELAQGSCAKRISDIRHLSSRVILLAYLNPIYYIYVVYIFEL